MCNPLGRSLTRKFIDTAKDFGTLRILVNFSELQVLMYKMEIIVKQYLLHIVFARVGEQ